MEENIYNKQTKLFDSFMDTNMTLLLHLISALTSSILPSGYFYL